MEIPMISMRELEWRLDRGEAMVLVDLRSRMEYEAGHLWGAQNVPYEEFMEGGWRKLKLLPDVPVYLYCARGSVSLLACRFLRKQGYPAVSAVGGFCAYRGPVYRGTAP